MINLTTQTTYRGLVKWYNNGLQNHCWEFDSLIPCHLNITPTYGVKYTETLVFKQKTAFLIFKFKVNRYYNINASEV